MNQREVVEVLEVGNSDSKFSSPFHGVETAYADIGAMKISRNIEVAEFGSQIGVSGSMPPFSYAVSKCECEGLKQVSRYLLLPQGWHFFASRDLAFSMAESGGAYVMLAGIAIDVQSGAFDLTALACELLSALRSSRDRLYDAVDRLAGRWVLIYSDELNSAPTVMGDATHSIKVNYTEDGAICSSNIFLINRILGRDEPEYRPQFLERRKLWLRGVLGNLQPIAGVKALTPNHVLDLGSGVMSRFFPREMGESNDVASVVEDIIGLCQIQIKALSEKYVLFNSLTAGIDSRFSLALSADDRASQKYFTYMFDEKHQVDVLVGNALADRLGLSHFAIIGKNNKHKGIRERISKSEIIDFEPNPALLDEIKKWDWYGSLPQATITYAQMLKRWRSSTFSEKQPLHIRSNLYEIGRAFWGARNGQCQDTDQILPNSRRDWQKDARGSFKRYFEEARLDRESCKGYDLLDMFYWEHRCGTWVNEVLQGTDFAFNTISYVNCRHIIKKLMSVDFEDRTNASVFKEIIARKLPGAADLPINPPEF